MALRFKTKTPNKLLNSFKKAIDDGRVVTWMYDKDGDFTHTTDQWKYSAWLRPKISDKGLTLSIIKPQHENISSEIYAIYHGRFVESMLVHCDALFTEVEATAYPEEDDFVASEN